MAYPELEIQIINLIAKDEMEAAIALLSKHFSGNEKLKAIVLQSGRFHSLKKDQANGVVDYATVQQTLNQLRANILDFMSSVRAAQAQEADAHPTAEKPGATDQFRPALARVAVLLLLNRVEKDQEGLTITEIYEASRIKSRKFIFEAVKEMEDYDLLEKQKKGRLNYWKLSGRGSKLAIEFEQSLLPILKKE